MCSGMFRDQPNEAVALLSVISHGPTIAFMKYFSWVFTPTKNRRLNELIGFLLFVSAVLLFLALASYSPLDPSLNTAAAPGASHPARNWIGLFGALLSDLWLQYVGIAVF